MSRARVLAGRFEWLWVSRAWAAPYAAAMVAGAWLPPVAPELDTWAWDALFITAGVLLTGLVLAGPRHEMLRRAAVFVAAMACLARAIGDVVCSDPTPILVIVWTVLAISVVSSAALAWGAVEVVDREGAADGT